MTTAPARIPRTVDGMPVCVAACKPRCQQRTDTAISGVRFHCKTASEVIYCVKARCGALLIPIKLDLDVNKQFGATAIVKARQSGSIMGCKALPVHVAAPWRWPLVQTGGY
jgi:hypothetical protein